MKGGYLIITHGICDIRGMYICSFPILLEFQKNKWYSFKNNLYFFYISFEAGASKTFLVSYKNIEKAYPNAVTVKTIKIIKEVKS